MQAWLRSEFRRLNTVLEFESMPEPRAALVATLLDGGTARLPPLPAVASAEPDVLVAHLEVGMFHAACARHGVRDANPRLRSTVDWLLEAERRWSLAPRFLALPYLMLNRAEEGWPLTFLESADERHFIAANADGLAAYEVAWTQVARIRALGLTHPSAPSLLRELARMCDRLVDVHRALQGVLGHDGYFHHVRHYYEGMVVDGRSLTGVNAGDQGWSMALDLALGVAQRHASYMTYLRSRLPYLPPSHRALVTAELDQPGWLAALVDTVPRVPWGRELAPAAVSVYDALVRVTWAHMDLAVAFIDRGRGTSGTELRFLEETVRMRRDHPSIAELRRLV